MDNGVGGHNGGGVTDEVVIVILSLVLSLAIVSVVGWVVSVRVHGVSVADEEVVVILVLGLGLVLLLTLVVVVAVWGTNDGVWVDGNGVVVP
jgi:hypothetical protein